MKHYNFEHTPDKLPPMTGIGWLLNNRIIDKAVEGTTQNLLDFYSFKYRRIPQVSSDDFVELCNKGIDAGFKGLLMCKQGIILNNFVEKSKPYWDTEYKDCVIVGHILDRGDAWWQIHPQTMWIDLEWWASVGKPEFGDFEENVEWTATNIERSEETLSDWQTYNPVSITATNETVNAVGKWAGHNLLNVAMQDNQKVGIWNKDLRRGKEYVYGENLDHYEKVHSIGKQLWVSRWFAANTETLDKEVQEQITSSVYSTCGGISPISNAYIRNLKPGGELVFYDADPLAVHMQNYMFNNWDGRNWKQLVLDYMEENPILGHHFACTDFLDEVDAYIDALGEPFQEWWNTTAKTFLLQFEEIDLMDINTMTMHLIDSMHRIEDDEKIFIDVSNAFNYEVNATLYSKNIRLNTEADYIKFFDNYKDKFIAKGFVIQSMNNHPKFEYLPKLFPWQKF
jgi:hypothetical protein